MGPACQTPKLPPKFLDLILPQLTMADNKKTSLASAWRVFWTALEAVEWFVELTGHTATPQLEGIQLK